MEVLGDVDGDTLVAVILQVAPEDRSRIGANAMVETELMRGAAEVPAQLWAVKMEADGSARIETAWPPGQYELRVTISNPSGTDSGLWVGTVNIPRFGKPTTPPVAPPSSPTPLAEPSLEEREDTREEAVTEPTPVPGTGGYPAVWMHSAGRAGSTW